MFLRKPRAIRFPASRRTARPRPDSTLFGLSAAREGASIGVRVHTIAPGAVETGMFRKIVPAEKFGTDRTLDPADVAKLIAQCVTGELRYTSGEVIYLQKTL